jgi:quercetin dioxygenase-like cupin family protein
MKSGKIWGITELKLSTSNLEVHRITVKNGGFCSLHRHKTKFNAFIVEHGQLEVQVHKDYGLIDSTILNAGDVLSVPPGEDHVFIARTDVVAYEVYWSQMDPDDIVRKNSGGVNS